MSQFRTDTKKLDGSNLITRYEVMMLSDQLTPGGGLVDAFGRIRIGAPYTLFESTHRYQDNNKWGEQTSGTANSQYKFHESAINLNVSNTAGAKVYRETKQVFAYQPGKSLMTMSTFAMNTAKTGLRQRIGYFNANNGIFFENFGSNNYMVLRSYTSGAVVERKVLQSSWNVDTFSGNSYSSQIGTNWSSGLNITKANIFWTDLQWLGVGQVRCGFVIDGKPIVAHIFKNANANTTTYMTTASLPLRIEIENVNNTTTPSTMKQICNTILSEGGYELQGAPRSITRAIGNPKDIPTAGTFVPIVSIRLKDARKDAVVIGKHVELFGLTNNTKYILRVVEGGTLTGASWVSANTNSAVEYDFSATAINGGVQLDATYLNVSAGAGGVSKQIDATAPYQLKRDPFAVGNNGIILSLTATGAGAGDDAIGHIAWQEVQ